MISVFLKELANKYPEPEGKKHNITLSSGGKMRVCVWRNKDRWCDIEFDLEDEAHLSDPSTFEAIDRIVKHNDKHHNRS